MTAFGLSNLLFTNPAYRFIERGGRRVLLVVSRLDVLQPFYNQRLLLYCKE